ncbi:MAG: AAA family ATPase [Myxococcales bacterium]|nr:AAA family ATPase [Myxococcales bacterium]
MRLLELGLLRYGGFTDARLDLSAPGLHIIFGRNEAGKSTALRGITALLYGVPHSTPDTYLHDSLSLSGVVCAADGTELRFERRKGRKNTLLAPDGTPLDERTLSHWLGGVGRSVFETAFGLDHARLRQGGELLATGGGDVGQSLFDAGIGGGSVKRVLDELGKEAEALFKASQNARSPEINAALRLHAEQVKAVRTAATRPEAWPEQQKALARAGAELAAIEARRTEIRQRLSAAQELVEVLPLIGRREAARAELAAVADAPLLPDDATVRRIEAEKTLLLAEREERQIAAELAEVDRELSELSIPESLLALSDTVVDALQARLGEYRGHQTDLVKRRAELGASEALVARHLAALGRSIADDPRALLPSRPLVARLKTLVADRTRLAVEAEQAEKLSATERARVEELEAELGLAPREIAELGVAPEHFDAVLPSREAIEDFADRFAAAARVRERLDERRAALDGERTRAEEELRALQLAGDVPTEAELARVRAQRDGHFSELRQALEAGTAGADSPVLQALAAAERRADETADRLRREATRVLNFASLEAKIARARDASSSLQAEQAEVDARAATLQTAWRELFAALGLEAQSPREMRGLLERWQHAREKLRGIELALARARVLRSSLEAAAAEIRASSQAWQARWAEAVSQLGLGADASPAEADEVQTALDEVRVELDKSDSFRHRIAGMEQTSAGFERDVLELVTAHAPELSELGVERAAAELISRHRSARQAQRRREDLSARRTRAGARTVELELGRAAEQRELSALMAQAGVNDSKLLAEAEARSTSRRAAEREIVEVERSLFESCGSTPLEEIRERALGVSLHEARARAVALEEMLLELDAERDSARDTERAAALGLERFDGNSAAADNQAEAEATLAKIRSAAERWARVRTAELVLRNEIERYRATHQGPLLERTNQIFPRLTLGAHAEVRVDLDAEPPALMAVSHEGVKVPIARLSDGACDQLYLALRLASVEHYARSNEPLPLILDDVLINFDEERARAALGVLAEIAASMQILLFTHHEHVVLAAEQTLGADAVNVHVLSRGEAPARRSPAPHPTV